MKILYYGETPCIETGGGQVGKHLVSMLAECGHTLEIVPINHTATMLHDREKWPHTFHYAHPEDMHNVENMKYHILHSEYDILFMTGDINILESFSDVILQARQDGKRFETVMYAAIDSPIFNPDYTRCLSIVEYPVVFSAFAHNVVVGMCPELEGKLKVIYHGCEPDIFHPVSPEEREETRKSAFDCGADDFLVMCINRNQVRKDLGRTMLAFHQFRQLRKDSRSRLYLHAKMQDLAGHLPTQAKLLGLDIAASPPEIIFAPPQYHETLGLSRAELNRIYTAADVIISTSTGEGWGLTTTEAMAAAVPFIGPRNTTFPEILGKNEERGYLAESGGLDLWSIHYGYSEGPRELVSTWDVVRKLERVYTHRGEAQKKAAAARAWTKLYTWDAIKEIWKEEILCRLQHPVSSTNISTIG